MKTENDFTENQNEEEKFTLLDWVKGLFGLLLFGTLVYVAIMVFDDIVLDSKIYANLTTKSDCEYNVPERWSIVTNGKMYAIKYNAGYYGDEYLRACFLLSDLLLSQEISKPTLFYSECKAKGYLKKYLEHKQPMRNFK